MKKNRFLIVCGLYFTLIVIFGVCLVLVIGFPEPKFKVGDCVVVRATGKAGRVVKVTSNAILVEYSYEPAGYIQPTGFLTGSNICAAPDSWCGE
jgi:hypothetical protein